MSYEHLRQGMANRWEYDKVRFIGKRFIQVRIIQMIDGLGDPRLGIAEHIQGVIFRFIQADISDRHTASTETLAPVIRQPFSTLFGGPTLLSMAPKYL